MAIKIRFDAAGNPEAPTVVLARRNGEKLGQIDAKNINISDSLNDASEMSFKVYKYLDGKECVLWDEIVNFKLVYCVEWNTWFEITVELDESNDIVKTVFATELEHAELGQIMLYNIEINTETDIAREDYKKPTVIFDETDPSVSLLNRIMEKAPHYEITHVDSSIASIQRTFTFDSVSLYDAFQNIAEEIQCIFILQAQSDGDGELRRTVEVYDLQQYCMSCQHRGDFVGNCPECGSSDIRDGYGDDTTIFVTADELADSIGFTTDTDAVKNCFKLEGGDDLMTATIRNCNPNGTDYLWYFSDDMKHDMPDELVEKIDSYDDLYEYYQKEHVVMQTANQALTDYNSLVNKYKVFRDDLETIDVPIVGYPALMNAYYNTIDMNLYLTSSMMPSPETMETDAHKEANKLTTANLSPVAVQNLEVMSNTTADNAVLAMARLVVDTRFKVKVVSSGLTGFLWTGSFEVTNYYDEEDTATTGNIVVQINDNYVEFVRQKVEKQLSRDSDDEVDIVGLFSMDQNNFVNELRKYSLNRLNAFQFACQAALDILIEQGIANKETWSSGDTNLYDDLYLPYLRKMDAINEEIALREKEIQVVVGKRDADGDIVEMGLQNYLDEYRDEIHDALDFEKYLGEELWHTFCSYRREDKYSNDNYISDALNNKQLFERAQEFIERATYEIHKSAEQQHSISSDLNNLLVIDKFKPLVDSFSVGNWLRAMVDGKVYKLRLIEYEIDYDSIDEVSVEFSDVIRSKDSASDIQNVLDQAQSMATSYDSVKRQAGDGKNSNDRLNTWVNDGLDLTNMKIVGEADNQNITWDANGLLAREYLPIIDAYDDRQLKLINRGLYVTDDSWETARAGIGNFLFWNPKTQQNEEAYGVIADTIVGNIVLSEEVGIYNKNNSITMDEDGLTLTTNADGVTPENVFTIQKENKDSSGESSIEKLLYVDNNGNLTINGNIRVSNSYSDVKTINDLGDADRIIESTTVIASIEADINGLRTEFGKTQQTVSEQGIQISSMSSSIQQNAEQIKLEVTNRQEAIDGAVNDMSTLIETTAGQLRVEISGAVDEAGNALNVANNAVKDVDVEYGISDSPTVEPTEWSTNSPQWQAGKYIWQRTKTVNSQGVANYSKAVCIQGAKGQDGIDGTNGTDGLPGKDGADGKDGTSSYVHIRYSAVPEPSDDQMSSEPAEYIGICVNNNPAAPTTASSYEWSKLEGTDGRDGLPGKDGEDGTSTYVHFAYSTSSDGSQNFSTTSFDGALYIGVLTDNNIDDSPNYADYAWSRMRGEDGTDGLPGKDGTNGKDGMTSYFHVAYANSIDGHTDFSTTDPTGRTYMGTYVDYVEADSDNPNSYQWTLIKGEDGADGLPGKDGVNGRTYYLHIAYANSADGSEGFSTVDGNNKMYIGQCVDENQEDPITYTSYTWSLFKGKDGTNGLPGRDGVDGTSSYVHIKYSPVPNPTDSQMTETPSEYIGICVDTNVSDPTTASSYTWSKIEGHDGANGLPGRDGEDGTSAYVHFAYATSADGSQNFSLTSFDGALYIGVLSDNNIDDSDNYADYLWSRMRGEDGKNGLPGKDGVSSYVHIKYSPVPNPTDDQISETVNTYIGICVDHNVNDPTTASSYSWTKLEGHDGEDGLPGRDGEDGTSAYVHFAYSTSADGSQNFSTTSFEGATYIGVLSDNNIDDSTNYQDYAWSKMKGEDGKDGLPGKDGTNGKDGVSSYVHIKYAPVPNPTDSQMTETPDEYIGLCVDTNVSDPTTADSYTWSKFEGKDGANGLPGQDGIDGTSTYVHFAYSTTSDGSGNFSTTPFDGAVYIGVLTDDNIADSNDYRDYAWSRMKGEDGTDGEAGRGVDQIIEQYAMNTNPNSSPTTGWSTAQPEWQSGYYIWTRSEIHWSDGEVTHTDPVLAKAINGANENANWVKSYMYYDATGLTVGAEGDPTELKMATANDSGGAGFKVKYNGNTVANLNTSLTFYANGYQAMNLNSSTLSFYSSGTQVASMSGSGITIGRTSSSYYNTYITSAGFYIRQGGTNLAQYTGNTISLGMNSESSVISLAGGAITITGTNGWTGLGKIANSGGAYIGFGCSDYAVTDTWPVFRSNHTGTIGSYGYTSSAIGKSSYGDYILGATVLYENTSGTNGTVPLSSSHHNSTSMSAMDITYCVKGSTTTYATTRVYAQNGPFNNQIACLQISVYRPDNGHMIVRSAMVYVSNDEITFMPNRNAIGEFGNNGYVEAYVNNEIRIVKVVGYR